MISDVTRPGVRSHARSRAVADAQARAHIVASGLGRVVELQPVAVRTDAGSGFAAYTIAAWNKRHLLPLSQHISRQLRLHELDGDGAVGAFANFRIGHPLMSARRWPVRRSSIPRNPIEGSDPETDGRKRPDALFWSRGLSPVDWIA